MTPISQIYLDLDGPLLEGMNRHYHCYRTILESFSVVPIPVEQYWTMKRNRVNRRELLKLSNAEHIYDDFLAKWLEIIESSSALALDRVQEGAMERLAAWRAEGRTISLVTMRSSREGLEIQLERTGLSTYLDHVLTCDHAEGGLGKAEAVRRYFGDSLESSKAMWIGDTEADWEAAMSLNCPVILVANGLRSREFLGTLEHALIVPSLSSITLPYE